MIHVERDVVRNSSWFVNNRRKQGRFVDLLGFLWLNLLCLGLSLWNLGPLSLLSQSLVNKNVLIVGLLDIIQNSRPVIFRQTLLFDEIFYLVIVHSLILTFL